MHIKSPDQIENVAWEGELASSETMKTFSFRSTREQQPKVTIGRPELWRVGEALKNEVDREWTPPLGDADFRLLRLACSLHELKGKSKFVEATLALSLRPASPDGAAYAFSMFPDRLGIENQAEFNVSLGPEATFATGAGFKLGELGAKIDYKKVFPVIESYGAGESHSYWTFKNHEAKPLQGCQLVYAVIVARPGDAGIRGEIQLTASVDDGARIFRFRPPEEVEDNFRFKILPS